MRSQLKRVLSAPQLEILLRDAAGISCHVQHELADGWFNTAFRVLLEDGRAAVVKVAPSSDAPVLRYERGIMATEAMFYRRVGALGGVPLPELLHAGPDFLVVAVLDGEPWDKSIDLLGPAARNVLLQQLGGIVAQFHALPNTLGYFGCPAPEAELRAGDWRTAFTMMVEAILEDAQRWASPLGITPAQVRALVAAGADALDEVRRPSLVHFDLWPANIFISNDAGQPRVTGLIDHERAFWGDPAAELVSLELCGAIGPNSEFLAGYRELGGLLEYSPSLLHRLALYRLYFGLILVTECGPRGFGPDHLAWCRTRLDAHVSALLNLSGA
ncbi:aminoglycoside phosphotransferase family protein [Streptomyces massasporeus]|uniref:phosphotransferase family protein n=1 Tax=Streptomyces massasporeus TaxID=67324 RepID=UPI0033E83A30